MFTKIQISTDVSATYRVTTDLAADLERLTITGPRDFRERLDRVWLVVTVDDLKDPRVVRLARLGLVHVQPAAREILAAAAHIAGVAAAL